MPARAHRPLTASSTVLAILLATMVSLAGCGGNGRALPLQSRWTFLLRLAAKSQSSRSMDSAPMLSEYRRTEHSGARWRGAYTWQAQTILPSLTLPSHVSMLTGFTPDVHGVVGRLPKRARADPGANAVQRRPKFRPPHGHDGRQTEVHYFCEGPEATSVRSHRKEMTR